MSQRTWGKYSFSIQCYSCLSLLQHAIWLWFTRTETFSFTKTIVLIIVLKYSFINKLFSPTVINCSSLTVDPSGQLRMSSCGNHYRAECNFSCTIGYRLNGSSTVTCVAPGNKHPGVWNNTIPTCEGKLKKLKLDKNITYEKAFNDRLNV